MPGVGHKTDPDFLIVAQRFSRSTGFSLCLYAPYTIMTPVHKPCLLPEPDSIGYGLNTIFE